VRAPRSRRPCDHFLHVSRTYPKESPAREGRNPGTGETIEIAASRKLAFVPAKQVKDTLAS